MMLVLNSEDLTAGTIANGEIKLRSPLTLDGKYRLVQFISQNSFYNTNLNNNVIYWRESGVPYSAELPIQYNTGEDLAAVASIQMNAVGANTYVVEFDLQLHKYQVSSNGLFTFDFNVNNVNSAHKLLGYPSTYIAPESLTSLSVNCIDLNPYRFLYFNSYDGSNGLNDSNGNNASFMIENRVGFGDVIRQNLSVYNTKLEYDKKRTFVYRITDREDNVIDFNGTNWQLLLESI